MSKPGVFDLSGDATHFVFGNWPLLKQSLKITFPLLLGLQIINQAGVGAGFAWMQFVTLLPMLFVYACYALTWHRNCLVAVDPSHVVNPFHMTKADYKFTGFFIALTGGLTLFLVGIGFTLQNVLPQFSQTAVLAGNIACLIGILLAMYVMLRLSFILPAQSVGVTLSLKEIIAASRGMTWPLIGANFIYAILFITGISVYSVIIGMLVSISAGDQDLKGLQFGFIALVSLIPVMLATLVLVALYTTALSKAYRWGMENNPVALS